MFKRLQWQYNNGHISIHTNLCKTKVGGSGKVSDNGFCLETGRHQINSGKPLKLRTSYSKMIWRCVYCMYNYITLSFQLRWLKGVPIPFLWTTFKERKILLLFLWKFGSCVVFWQVWVCATLGPCCFGYDLQRRRCLGQTCRGCWGREVSDLGLGGWCAVPGGGELLELSGVGWFQNVVVNIRKCSLIVEDIDGSKKRAVFG